MTRSVEIPEACVFCTRISRGEYDKEYPGFSFEPLNPVVPGHRLFLPGEHVTDASQDPAVTGKVFAAAAEYARRQGDDFNLITSGGEWATQTVFHLHVHYVPRTLDDSLALPWTEAALPYLAPAEHNHPQVCCCPDINAYPCPETCPACFKHGRSLPYFTPAGDDALRHALEQLANIWAAPDAPTVGIRVAAHMLREVLAVHPAAAQPAGDVCSACGSGILQPVITGEHIRDDLPPCFGSPAVPQPVDREALEAGYEAVYSVIRAKQQSERPSSVQVNALIWSAVHAFREALGIPALAGEQEQVEK